MAGTGKGHPKRYRGRELAQATRAADVVIGGGMAMVAGTRTYVRPGVTSSMTWRVAAAPAVAPAVPPGEEAPAAATDGGAAAGDAGGDGGGAATGGGATGGAGAADGDATIAFLRRDNLAENCAAHVRAMVDDGAVAVTAGYDV